MFEKERDRLLSLCLNRIVDIQHFGSTAVEGLAAKPIIDMLTGVRTMAETDTLMKPLCQYGYATSTEFNATLKDRRWLMKHANGRRTHHLHLVVHRGKEWEKRLKFRNMLRANAELASRYEQLKRKLAVRFRQDREAYTRAKEEFVSAVIAEERQVS